MAEELTQKAELLYGLHVVAARSIGMADAMTEDEEAAHDPAEVERAARRWLRGWRTDPDVRVDPRVAVPMVHDTEANVSRNLGVVGVKALRMHASFPEGYTPQVVGGDCEAGDFVPFEPYLLVEQTLEFARDLREPPLTREQYRSILDEHTSLDSMRAALEER